MQLPVVFPWKSTSAVSKPNLALRNIILGPFFSCLVRKRLDVTAGKGKASSEGPLGSPGCTDPEQLWLQVAAFPEGRADPVQSCLHAVLSKF